MCLDKRNGTSEPASRATQRCCGLFSWSCRPDLATARRAGWSHAQETGIVRRRAGPLPSALGRVQKTRGGPFGTLPKSGRAAAVAGRILASHNRTIPRLFASVQRQRQCCSRAPQIRLRNDEQRCCRDQKLLHPILHGPAQVDTMRQTVLALAICGASALQPARNARRQSLAVRQAPRGVRQRVLDGVRVEDRESRRHRRDDSTA